MHLPAPKTHFTRDIELSADTPVFATSKELSISRGGYLDEVETNIKEEKQVNLPPCGKCFSELVLTV